MRLQYLAMTALCIVACRGETDGGGGGGGAAGGAALGGDEGGGVPATDGIEEGPQACANGADDDGDGYTDCADRDCAITAPTICAGEDAGSGKCADGIDNDGDGFVDGSDDSCEENTAELCTDGIDNDGNGYVDCGDFGCSRNPDLDLDCPSEDTDELCQDGVDNDGNSYVDCDDYGCSRNPDVTICPEGEGGDGGGDNGGGDNGGGDEDPCGQAAPAGVCADPAEVCDAGQCVARGDEFGVPAAAGDLLITEYMANVELPDVPDNEKTAEWFEIHNAMDKPVDLRGLRISDDGSDSAVLGGADPIVIDAGGFAVLGRSTDKALNGDVDVLYAYGSEFTLANGDDEIAIALGEVVLDHVAYTGDFPHGAGVSAAVNPEALDHTSNDDKAGWCPGAAAWSETSAQKGSPGVENPPCG